jgi:hypothetical protein
MPRPCCMWLCQVPSYLPPPRNIKPQKTPAQAPANPRQSPPRLHALACPHTTPASRQHHLPPPLCCADARDTSRHHTRPHTLSSLTGTHTLTPVAPASPARRLVLCHAPAMTPTPHSPVYVGPGEDASSVPLAVEVVPIVPAPTPQHKTPKDPRQSTRKTPSVSASPPSTRSPAITHAPTR